MALPYESYGLEELLWKQGQILPYQFAQLTVP